MWEVGVRVGWGVNARDQGGSGGRLAYITDLYVVGEGSNLLGTNHT